jgi:hypothetical protein
MARRLNTRNKGNSLWSTAGLMALRLPCALAVAMATACSSNMPLQTPAPVDSSVHTPREMVMAVYGVADTGSTKAPVVAVGYTTSDLVLVVKDGNGGELGRASVPRQGPKGRLMLSGDPGKTGKLYIYAADGTTLLNKVDWPGSAQFILRIDDAVPPAGGTGSAPVSTPVSTPIAAPTITSLSLTAGPSTGGTAVTITGTGFTGATGVTFGGVAGTAFTVTDATHIAVTTPAGAGAVNVVVNSPNGTGSLANGFTYAPTPTITSLSQATGPAVGGTAVTITGTGFTGATGVTFGGVAGTAFTVTDATHIAVTTPAGAGAVNVVVNSPNGNVSKANGFTYAPTITTLSQATGPGAGGTALTITGTGFTGATGVTFGGVAGTAFTVTDATHIAVTTPAGAGALDVVVNSPSGNALKTNGFTYAPTVTSLSPTGGPLVGNQTVTVNGGGFLNATGVTFGGTAGTGLSVTNAGQLTVVTPMHSAGASNVVVTGPGGSSPATVSYTYFPVPTLAGMGPIAPTSGTGAGGTSVTITGTGFTGATGVKVGPANCAAFTVVNDTTITATTAAGPVGAAAVAVTTPGGTATTAGAFTFSGYLAPATVPIGPAGPMVTVTVNGSGFLTATGVDFAGLPATNVVVVSDNQITLNPPISFASAPVNVVVHTPGGDITFTNGCTYQ